jgi:predicted transposase/invertase (TIGR01784 family)
VLELGSIKKTRVYQEAHEEGRAEGEIIGKLAAVPALHLQGFSVEKIARTLGLTVEQVQSALPNS